MNVDHQRVRPLETQPTHRMNVLFHLNFLPSNMPEANDSHR